MLQEFLRINKEMHFHSLPYNFVFRFVCLVFFFIEERVLKEWQQKKSTSIPVKEMTLPVIYSAVAILCKYFLYTSFQMKISL